MRNDPAAFGQVFDEWYKPVFGYITRRTADYDLSKDIAAETFLKAFLKINTFRWQGISLSAWLYRIAAIFIGTGSRSHSVSDTLINFIFNLLLIGLIYTVIAYFTEARKKPDTDIRKEVG
jgi:hypothetical protein